MRLVILALLALLADAPVDRSKFVMPPDTTLDDARQITAPGGDDRANDVLVLRGGLVFTATGAAPSLQTVVVRGRRITSLLPPDARAWPDTAKVIDVTGKFVMPGLIDAHVHLTYDGLPGQTPDVILYDGADAALRGAERLRFYLESGITTVRDLGSHGHAPFRLKQWVAEGRLPGPRILTAGQLITGTGGHGADGEETRTAPGEPNGSVREASGADGWRDAVRVQFKRGADLIKLGSHFSPPEIGAAVDEAHRLGLKVTVDTETLFVDMAAEAGVDCIEHALPRSDRAVALMAQKKICAVPTLVPYEIMIDRFGGYYGTPSRRFSITKSDQLAMLRKLRDAGIKLGVGTDLVGDWFRYLPAPYIAELKHLQAVGYTPSDALVAATRTNAEILGLGDRLGTIAPGRLADLLVVDGRPDRSLDDLAKVQLVVRDGRVAVEDGRLFIERHAAEKMPAAQSR
jgi:imidazolonepropionase-like amidohydrolase